MKWSAPSVYVCVRMEYGVSGVMLHFNEVLPAPLSCHFDHTVTYKLMWTSAYRHTARDGAEWASFAGTEFSFLKTLTKIFRDKMQTSWRWINLKWDSSHKCLTSVGKEKLQTLFTVICGIVPGSNHFSETALKFKKTNLFKCEWAQKCYAMKSFWSLGLMLKLPIFWLTTSVRDLIGRYLNRCSGEKH